MSATRQLRPAAQPGSARLGERVRQLRVAAGLTQTDLAGDRFSKEYVSQIERGKTRPTRETIEWLAGKLGVDAGFLERGVSADERSRVETMLARAEALTERRALRRGDRGVRATSRRRCSPPARSTSRSGRSPAEAWALVQGGDVRGGIARLRTGAPADRAARVLGHRPGRPALPAGRLPLHAFEHRHRARALQRGARARRAAPACRATRSAPRSSTRARSATATSATSRPRARTSSARSSSPRRWTTGARWRTSSSRPRWSPSGWATGCSPAATPSAPTAHYEELNDGRKSAGVLNNLGGLNFLLGKPEQAIEHLKASFSAALEVDSDREGRPGGRLAGDRAPAPRRLGSGGAAGASRARAARPTERITCTRSRRPSSSWGARSWSRTSSTRPSSGSAPPTRVPSDWSRSAIERLRGSPSATSRPDGTISLRRPSCTGALPRHYRMSASKEPKEVNMNKARMISFVVTSSVLVASSSRLRTWAAPLPRKERQLGRVVGHPRRVRSGV